MEQQLSTRTQPPAPAKPGRPVDAQQWVDLGLEGRETITPEMYGDVKGRVAEFRAGHIALTIDGEPAEPVLDRIHFLRRTLRTSTVIDPPEELSLFTAQLGAIFVVPRDALPQAAEVTWDLFTDKIPVLGRAQHDFGEGKVFGVSLTALYSPMDVDNVALPGGIVLNGEYDTPMVYLLGMTYSLQFSGVSATRAVGGDAADAVEELAVI